MLWESENISSSSGPSPATLGTHLPPFLPQSHQHEGKPTEIGGQVALSRPVNLSPEALLHLMVRAIQSPPSSILGLGLAAGSEETRVQESHRGKGQVLLTTPVGSSGEVVGGLHAHQRGFGASDQERWRQQVLKAFLGHPLSEREGQTKSHPGATGSSQPLQQILYSE